jgi:hypothetical protein
MNLRVYQPRFDNIICPRQENKLVSSSVCPSPLSPATISKFQNYIMLPQLWGLYPWILGSQRLCADSCLWGMNQRSLWSTRSVSFLPRPGISLVPSCRYDTLCVSWHINGPVSGCLVQDGELSTYDGTRQQNVATHVWIMCSWTLVRCSD